MANDGDTAEAWMLTLADRTLVMTKSGVNRLRFAVLLLFCRTHGRFPGTSEEIDDAIVVCAARQLGIGTRRSRRTRCGEPDMETSPGGNPDRSRFP